MTKARKAAAALLFLAFGIGVGALAVARPAAAQTPNFDFDAREERVEISADSIEYRYPNDLYVAEGHVRVVQGDRSLRANWATFSARTRQAVASGDVVYHDGNEVLEARFVQFGLDSLAGVVLGSELDLGEQGFRIAAEELIRTGEDRYQIFDARFTACRCPDPDARLPWEFAAAESEIRVGGYGTSRNTTLEVLGVPVIWLPWMMYPVKTERQTGVLMPEFSLGGRNGLAGGLPLFWAARRNLNVMATPSYSKKRGFKQNVEVEAVYGERSRTLVRGAYGHENDRNFAPLPARRELVEAGIVPDNGHLIRERGFVAVEHDQDLPAGIRLKADGAWMTDNEYVLDYDDLAGHRRDRFLESVAFATRSFGDDGQTGHTGRLGVQVASRFADDLQSPQGIDRDKFLLQRYADVEAQWLTGSLLGVEWLTGGFDVDYEFFGRRNDASNELSTGTASLVGNRFYDVGIDATTRSVAGTVANPVPIPGWQDGAFQEGEPLADKGQRLTVHPRLGVPLRLWETFETFTEGGYRQTMYWSQLQGFEERGQITGRSEIAMRLSRDYAREGKAPLRHELTPKLEWAFVDSERGQKTNPLFVPRTKATQSRLRQRQFDSVVLDSADEVRTTNRVSARLDNRLYRGKGIHRRLAGEFGLGFDYDFKGSNVGHIVAEGRRIQLGPAQVRFQVAYEAGKKKIDEGYAELGLPLFGTARATLRYRYIRQAPEFFELFNSDVFNNGHARDFDKVSQVSMHVVVPLFDRFVLGYNGNYSLLGSQFLTNSGSFDYISTCDCWAAGIQVSNSRNENLRFQVRYSILGFGDNIQNPFAADRQRFDR